MSVTLLEVALHGGETPVNPEDMFGWSEAIDISYFDQDIFKTELKSYNYGSAIPEAWNRNDFLDYIAENTHLITTYPEQLLKYNYIPKPEDAIILSLQDLYTRMPTYNEAISGASEFIGSVSEMNLLIGDINSYISIGNLPDNMIIFGQQARDLIYFKAINNNWSTPDILNNSNSILIKYPLEGNMLKYWLQIPDLTDPLKIKYKFYITILPRLSNLPIS